MGWTTTLPKVAGAEPVIISVSHGVLVGEAVERLDRPSVRALVTTNTVPVAEAKRMNGAVTVLTIAPLLADAIARIHNRQSVSEVFRAEQQFHGWPWLSMVARPATIHHGINNGEPYPAD